MIVKVTRKHQTPPNLRPENKKMLTKEGNIQRCWHCRYHDRDKGEHGERYCDKYNYTSPVDHVCDDFEERK